jgi:hypothetical protein
MVKFKLDTEEDMKLFKKKTVAGCPCKTCEMAEKNMVEKSSEQLMKELLEDVTVKYTAKWPDGITWEGDIIDSSSYIVPKMSPSYDYHSASTVKPYNHNPYGKMSAYDNISRKDLIGVIRTLLEELGRATVRVPKAGTTFINNDTVVNSSGPGTQFISFRSLLDKDEEE